VPAIFRCSLFMNVEPMVTNLNFSQKCTIWAGEMKLIIVKAWTFVLKMKSLNTVMKNWNFVIDRVTRLITRLDRNMENCSLRYYSYAQQFHYKTFAFAEPLDVARETPVFRGTQFDWHSLSVRILLINCKQNAAAVGRALIDFKLNIYVLLILSGTLKRPTSNSVVCDWVATVLTFWRRNYFFNLSTPCI